MINNSGLLWPGDIYLTDSNKAGPRWVKFFMTAPTVWHHIYRAIRKKQEKVRVYHAGIVDSPSTGVIEQQFKVEKSNTQKKIFGKKHVVYRRKNITMEQRLAIVDRARKDIGSKWDVLHIVGKTLTWLTGIKLFVRYIQWPKAEICVNRVGKWYKDSIGESFGKKTHYELTTHDMDKWCKNHPEEWEIVSINIE